MATRIKSKFKTTKLMTPKGVTEPWSAPVKKTKKKSKTKHYYAPKDF